MHLIDNVLISDEVVETHFRCDIKICKGNCCRFGDLGAPIDPTEKSSIEALLPKLKHILSKKSFNFLSRGITEVYGGRLNIREIAPDHPCPFGFFEKNDDAISCSLHRFAHENNLSFSSVKPLWCSLFPLMIKKTEENYLLNMRIPHFCHSISPAPPLLLAFQEPLTFVFGQEWMKKVKKLFV